MYERPLRKQYDGTGRANKRKRGKKRQTPKKKTLSYTYCVACSTKLLIFAAALCRPFIVHVIFGIDCTQTNFECVHYFRNICFGAIECIHSFILLHVARMKLNFWFFILSTEFLVITRSTSIEAAKPEHIIHNKR